MPSPLDLDGDVVDLLRALIEACWIPLPRAAMSDAEGSSHHVHVSLWRGDANAFVAALVDM